MAARRRIPESVETAVLTKSRRGCCFCFGLSGDLSANQGQLAHIDRDPGNNAEDNLAYLCLDHHDEYDSRRSQSKGLTEGELRSYRDALYQAIEEGRPTTPPDTGSMPENNALGAALSELRAAYGAYAQTVLPVVFCPGSWLNEGRRAEPSGRRSVDSSKCIPGGEWAEDGPSDPKVRAAFEDRVGGAPLHVHMMGEVRDGAYSCERELSGGAFLLVSGPDGEHAAAELIRLSNVLGTLLPSDVADGLGCGFSESPAALWAAFVLNQPTCEAHVEHFGWGLLVVNFFGASLRAFELLLMPRAAGV